MGNLEWWNYLIVTLILGIIFFIGGHVQTCYYPFLLTRKFYIVIKNPKLQKILISDQLNRNRSSRTRLEDRNKLPIHGFVHYIIQSLLLGTLFILELYLIISKMTDIAFNMAFFDEIWSKFTLVLFAFFPISAVLYLIDYGLEKLINGH